MIYILHVQSGAEYDIVWSLVNNEIKAYAPRHELLERRKGEWHTVQREIFPGYVFVDVQMTDEIYYKLKKTSGVIRILGDPTPLSFSEQTRIQWLLDAGLVGVSKGVIRNGTLQFVSGLLVGREKEIVSISRRHKRCKLSCIINGRKHTFSVSAEIEKL